MRSCHLSSGTGFPIPPACYRFWLSLKPAVNSIFNLNQRRSSHLRNRNKRITSFPVRPLLP